jgi:GAF domain
MRWLTERFKRAINSGIEGLIWIALVAGAIFAWKKRDAHVTLPVWVLVLALGIPAAIVLTLLVRRWRHRGLWGETADLQAEIDLGANYSRHVYDILDTLQKVLSGAIPRVSARTFIEQGVLDPARDFLMQRPGEDVRLSVLAPDNGTWTMPLAAGYRLESRQRFSLPIVGSFSRHAFESGEIQWSFDLQADPRFTPHPQASRVYHSIISVPIRRGDATVAVFNADSTLRSAFSLADFIYVSLIGAIISVVAGLDALDQNPPPLGPGDGDQDDGADDGGNGGDGRDVN